MKLLKVLTSLTLVVSLMTLQIEGGRLVLAQAQAQSSQNMQVDKDEVKISVVGQITTMASLVLAPILLGSCGIRSSAAIFAGGAAALLAGEITGYAMFNSASKKREERVKEKIKTNNDHEYLLREQAQQERDAAKAVDAKSWLTMTAAIAYSAGAIMSVVEAATDYPKFIGSCVASTNPSDEVRYMADFNEARYLFYPHVQTGEDQFGQHMAMVTDYQRFLAGEKQSLSVDEYDQVYKNYDVLISKDDRSVLTQLFDTISNAIFPVAHAGDGGSNRGGSMTSGISAAVGGTALAAIMGVFSGSSPAWITTVMTSGWGRSALFGIFAGLAWTAFADLRKAKSALDERAKKIDAVADQLKNLENPAFENLNGGGPSGGPRGNPGLAGPGGRDTDVPSGGEGPTGPCMSGSYPNMSYDSSCSCLQTNSCTQVPTASNNQGFNQQLPAGFGTAVGNFSSGVNDYMKGKSSGLDMANGAFGQNAAANLKRIKEQVLAKANDNLKKNNKQPVDLDKLGKELQDQVVKSMEDAMKRLPANQLAALEQGFGTGTGSIDSKKETPEAIKEVLASVELPAADGKSDGADFSGIEMDGALAQEDNNLIAQQGEILNQFITNESDISDKPGASLFQIISVRYVKSGYPRLLKKESKHDLD